MLKVNLHLFGVPGQFESFPAKMLTSYYQQFYDNRSEPWRFLVRRDERFIRYIYIQYGLTSGVNRKGSLIGISVELEDYYFKTPRTQVLLALREILGEFLADGIIISYIGDDAIRYSIASFGETSTYIKDKIARFEQLFESNFKNDAVQLPKNFDHSLANKIVQFEENDKNDEEIVKYFLQYGGVNIVPVNVKQNIPQPAGPQIVGPSSKERKYQHDIILLKQTAEAERKKAVEATEKEKIALERAEYEGKKRREAEAELEALKQKKEDEKVAEVEQQQLKSLHLNNHNLQTPIPSGILPQKGSGYVRFFLGGILSPGNILLALIILAAIIVFIKLIGPGTSGKTDTSNGSQDIAVDSNFVESLSPDKKDTTPFRTSTEIVDTPKLDKPSGKTRTTNKQLINNLNGEIKDYIETMPSSDKKDQEFERQAAILNCKAQVEVKLDKHRADARLFSVMVTENDPDIKILKTISYQIAVLLTKNHSDIEVIEQMKKINIKITAKKINKVRKNLGSF